MRIECIRVFIQILIQQYTPLRCRQVNKLKLGQQRQHREHFECIAYIHITYSTTSLLSQLCGVYINFAKLQNKRKCAKLLKLFCGRRQAHRSFSDAAKQKISFEFDIICAQEIGMSGCSKEAHKNDDDHGNDERQHRKRGRTQHTKFNCKQIPKYDENSSVSKQDFNDNKHNE